MPFEIPALKLSGLKEKRAVLPARIQLKKESKPFLT